MSRNLNHPKPDSIIRADPVRSIKDVEKVGRLLNERNRALWVLGTNTNLRASDIVKLKVGDVMHLQPGDPIRVREKKTEKALACRRVNKKILDALAPILAGKTDGNQFLFESRKGAGPISVPYLSQMVKGWCRDAGLKGNFSSHTMRKTFGHLQVKVFKVRPEIMMGAFGHATLQQTIDYLGLDDERSAVFLNEI